MWLLWSPPFTTPTQPQRWDDQDLKKKVPHIPNPMTGTGKGCDLCPASQILPWVFVGFGREKCSCFFWDYHH
jgi:hypothetical protein